MPIEVKVKGVRSGGTRKHVIATARVELTSEPDTVIILDTRVLLSKKGALFVSYPNQSIGKGKFVAILDFSKDLKERIRDLVLAEYEAYRQNKTEYGLGEMPQPEGIDPDVRGQSDGR